GIARRQLGPGVADADHRPAVEEVGGQPLVLHPAAVAEAVAVGVAEPRRAAQLALFLPRIVRVVSHSSYASSPGRASPAPISESSGWPRRRRRPAPAAR